MAHKAVYIVIVTKKMLLKGKKQGTSIFHECSGMFRLTYHGRMKSESMNIRRLVEGLKKESFVPEIGSWRSGSVKIRIPRV